MNYLSHYMQAAQTAALEKAGAFFAFSNGQLEEGLKGRDIKDFFNMGDGMICPKDKAADLNKDLQKAVEEGIEADIKDNGIEAIIKRELNNHEAYYTMDISDTVDALADYPGVAEDMVQEVFNKYMKEHTDD